MEAAHRHTLQLFSVLLVLGLMGTLVTVGMPNQRHRWAQQETQGQSQELRFKPEGEAPARGGKVSASVAVVEQEVDSVLLRLDRILGGGSDGLDRGHAELEAAGDGEGGGQGVEHERRRRPAGETFGENRRRETRQEPGPGDGGDGEADESRRGGEAG